MTDCPNCGTHLSAASTVPPEQRLTVKITSESELIDALALGQILTETAKAMSAVARELGQKVAVFVESVKIEANVAEATLLIVEHKSKK